MDSWPVCARDEELERVEGVGRVEAEAMGAKDEDDRFGRVRTRDGCWRIRSSPDGPSP